MSVFLDLSDAWPYSNSSDEIKFIKVSTKSTKLSGDFHEELSEVFAEALRSQLISMGYEIKENSTSLGYGLPRPSGSYMLIGKEVVQKGMFALRDESYETYNAVEFESGYWENDINFYSNDELKAMRFEEPELSTTPDTTLDTTSVQDLAHWLNELHKNAGEENP